MRIGIGTISIFVFILFSFFHVSSFDLQINDRDICTRLACFVPGECAGGEDAEDLKPSTFFHSSCRFVFMIRTFTTRKLRVYIIFNGTEFTFQQKTKVIFGVKMENDDVIAIKGQYVPGLLSKNIGSDTVTAEFIIEDTKDILTYPLGDFVVSVIENQATTTWRVGPTVFKAEMESKVFCDPDLILSNSSTTFKDIEPVDLYHKDLRCRDPSTQAVVYVDHNDNVHTGADIKCDLENGKQLVYKVTTKTGQFEHTNDTFTAFCTTLPCTQCTTVSLPSKCNNCMLPTFVKSTSPSTCSELKCPGDNFLIEGKESVVAKPTCIATSKNESKWSINGKTFESASCPGNKQCAAVNPLKVSNCDACDKINVTQNSVVCPKGAKLRGSYEADKWLVFESIECDKRTGEWVATMKGDIELTGLSKMTVQCYRGDDAKSDTASAGFEFSLYNVLIGIAAGLAIAVILGLLGYLIYRLCHRSPPKTTVDTHQADPSVKLERVNAENPESVKISAISTVEEDKNEQKKVEDNKRVYTPYKDRIRSKESVQRLSRQLSCSSSITESSRSINTDIKEAEIDAENEAHIPENIFNKNMDEIKEDHTQPDNTEKKKETVDKRNEDKKVDGSKSVNIIKEKKEEKNRKGVKENDKETKSSKKEKKNLEKEVEKKDKKNDDKKEKKESKVDKESELDKLQPRDMGMDDKRIAIAQGLTRNKADYPTMKDIESDWDSIKEKKKEGENKDKDDKDDKKGGEKKDGMSNKKGSRKSARKSKKEEKKEDKKEEKKEEKKEDKKDRKQRDKKENENKGQ